MFSIHLRAPLGNSFAHHYKNIFNRVTLFPWRCFYLTLYFKKVLITKIFLQNSKTNISSGVPALTSKIVPFLHWKTWQ
eukprot:UN09272